MSVSVVGEVALEGAEEEELGLRWGGWLGEVAQGVG